MSKESYRDSNKPVIKVNNINQLLDENPNMMYAEVRVDEGYTASRSAGLDAFLSNGWEVVMEEQNIVNDYDSEKSRDKEPKDKPSLLTRNGRGGAKFVYVCKTKEDFIASERNRIKQDQEAFLKSTKGRKVKKDGRDITITDPEVSVPNK